MPIDFPASPTDGQIYTVGSRSWTYNSANGTWDATSITTGPKGGIPYKFSTTITDADPGNGFIRYNNAIVDNATFIYIDDRDANGNNWGDDSWYNSWDDSTNPNQKGYLYVQGNSASSTVVNIFSITGTVTSATGYYKIPVSSFNGGNLPANNESISVSFVRTGNQGTQGTTGTQGTIGSQGLAGTQGTIGSQGLAGAQGIQGITGPTGVDAVTTQTGATYTFVLTDKDNLVRGNSSSAQTFSVPTNATTAFSIGDMINVAQIGTGQITINAVTPATTTIASTGTVSTAPKLRAQYSVCSLIKVETDVWYVTGDIE